ncbi:MAG: type II toxin-antitoxin system VapC family toxin [Rhodospirillales bacterium]|nr:type II toxin-antitoxin system VapC family toxin [Rhodospirillales bacterium]
MNGYVIDASVAVKWLVDEAYSKEADALLTSGSMFIAPSLVFAESVNALWAMHQRGDISGQDLSDAVDTLLAAPTTFPVSVPQLSAAAARLASDLGHPAYDCFYLALAIQSQYPVVIADSRFHDRVRIHSYLADRIVHLAEAVTRTPGPRDSGPS